MPTVTLRPNSDVSTQWSSEPVGDHYACVDEETPNDDTDYIYTDGYGLVDRFDLPDSGLSSETINKVTFYYRARKTTEDLTKIRLRVYVGATENFLTALETLTTDYVTYSEEHTTNPLTEEAWTVSDVDSLNPCPFAVTDQKMKRLTALWVVIDYTSGVIEKSVAGLVGGSGSVLVNKTLMVSGAVDGSGSLLRDKSLIVAGLTEGLGAVDVQTGVTQKEVAGLVDALGSVLRNKTVQVLGSADGQCYVVVDKGEVYVLRRVKVEDIYK